jgi:hypothetical protein
MRVVPTLTFDLLRTGHWIKMRRSLAPFSGPESLVHTRSLADFITTTSAFRFSVHTGGRLKALKRLTARELFMAFVVLIMTVTATAWLNGRPRLSVQQVEASLAR